VADGEDQGESGPGGSGLGAREKRETVTGQLWGTDMPARAAQCRAAWFKPDLNKIRIQMFQTVLKCFKLWSIRKALFLA
jgi:hypothetical protein